MTEESNAEPGDVGEEAHRLLAAVQEWARRTLPAPPSGHPGPECQWCPLCQAASVLRGEHPELTERVADAGAAILHAARALVEAASARAAAGSNGAGGSTRDPGRPEDDAPSPTHRVQHISLDETGPRP